MERRFLNTARSRVECRGDTAGNATVEGYAAVFYDGTPDTQFELWDGAVERVMPQAFDRALVDNDDARALFNHDPNQLLGRRSADTLKLSKDGSGLRYSIVTGDTAVARDVVQHIRRGDLQGSSFAFRVLKQEWREEKLDDGHHLEIREILDVELFDVGPVTFPAYEATTTDVRSADGVAEARSEHDRWVAGVAARRRSVEIEARAREISLDSATSVL